MIAQGATGARGFTLRLWLQTESRAAAAARLGQRASGLDLAEEVALADSTPQWRRIA